MHASVRGPIIFPHLALAYPPPPPPRALYAHTDVPPPLRMFGHPNRMAVVPRNDVLPCAILRHDHVPGRLLLPRRDAGTDRVSQGVPLSLGELRARGLLVGHVLSEGFGEQHVVPAGVARQPDLKQHAGVERRGV